MAIRMHHLRFVNFETWLEFQGVHPEDTRHAAEISWQRMISDGEVSRLYDVMGEVYLGLSIQTLRRCMPADSLAALLLDWYSEGPDPHRCLGGVQDNNDPFAGTCCPPTPTSSEQGDFPSPSPPSFRSTPSPQPEHAVINVEAICMTVPDQVQPSGQESVCSRGLPIETDSDAQDDDLERACKKQRHTMSPRPFRPGRADSG